VLSCITTFVYILYINTYLGDSEYTIPRYKISVSGGLILIL
jgi:hypothetical protein